MRSVVVVLPASMWAMIPMLRTWARGLVRVGDASGIARSVRCLVLQGFSTRVRWGVQAGRLPAVVSEGFVGLGHLVHVLTALDGGADAVGRVEQLGRQLLGHGLLPALLGVADQPAHRKGGSPARADLHRHLVGGAP